MKTVELNHEAGILDVAMGFAADDTDNANTIAGITDELVVGDDPISNVLENIIYAVRAIDGNDSILLKSELKSEPITIAEARLVLMAFQCGTISERKGSYQNFLTRQEKDRTEVVEKLFPMLSEETKTLVKTVVVGKKIDPIITPIIKG
jgi:hypothetical protein